MNGTIGEIFSIKEISKVFRKTRNKSTNIRTKFIYDARRIKTIMKKTSSVGVQSPKQYILGYFESNKETILLLYPTALL